MRSVLLLSGLFLATVVAAQDFTSLFLKGQPSDSAFVHITIGPRMMEEILQVDSPADNELYCVIANLKSMRMLSAEAEGAVYYAQALEILDRYPKRFQLLYPLQQETGDCCLIIRKKKKAIVELVLLVNKNNQFTVINFTGNMNEKFIKKLTGSLGAEEITT